MMINNQLLIRARKYWVVVLLTFLLIALNNKAHAQDDEQYLIQLMDTLHYSVYTVNPVPPGGKVLLSPGTYVKTNITCEQRKRLLQIDYSSFITVLNKNLELGEKMNALLYDITQTDATGFIYLRNQIGWSKAFWVTQIEYWSSKPDTVVRKEQINCW